MAVQLLVNFAIIDCQQNTIYLGSKVDSVKLWPNEKFESFYTSNFHKTFERAGQKSCQKSLHKPCTLVDQKVIVITRHLVFLPCGLGFCSFPWHYDWINYQQWGRCLNDLWSCISETEYEMLDTIGFTEVWHFFLVADR